MTFFQNYFLFKALLNQSCLLKAQKKFVLIHNQAWANVLIYFLVSFKYLQLRIFQVHISYKQKLLMLAINLSYEPRLVSIRNYTQTIMQFCLILTWNQNLHNYHKIFGDLEQITFFKTFQEINHLVLFGLIMSCFFRF